MRPTSVLELSKNEVVGGSRHTGLARAFHDGQSKAEDADHVMHMHRIERRIFKEPVLKHRNQVVQHVPDRHARGSNRKCPPAFPELRIYRLQKKRRGNKRRSRKRVGGRGGQFEEVSSSCTRFEVRKGMPKKKEERRAMP